MEAHMNYNGASLPSDSIAIDTDKHGIRSYASPVPGIDTKNAIVYKELLDHIPYLHYGEPGKNTRGGTIVFKSLYKGSGPLRIQLAEMSDIKEDNSGGINAPFGLQMGMAVQGETVNPDRQNLDISLENPDLIRFFELINQRNIEVACKRWADWGQKHRSESNITAIYKDVINTPSPPKPGEPPRNFPNTVRLKVVLAGKNPTKTYEKVGVEEDGTWQLISVDPRVKLLREPGKRLYLIPIIMDTGLWFMGGAQFGNGFQLSSAIILPTASAAQSSFSGIRFKLMTPQPQYGLPAPLPSNDVTVNQEDGTDAMQVADGDYDPMRG
jgi:hypothetical protein